MRSLVIISLMLDVAFIRENTDLVKEGARKKKVTVDIDHFLELDEKRRSILTTIGDKRAEQNKASALIAQASNEERPDMIEAVSKLKAEIQELEESLKPIKEEWHTLLMDIPNPPSEEMPLGESDEDNVTVREWGKKPSFDFTPLDHATLGRNLDLIDLETAAEVSGSRFYYLKGDLVLMQFAIVQWTMATLGNTEILKKVRDNAGLEVSSIAFTPMLPPVIVRKEVQAAIHRVFGDQTYSLVGEEQNLIASAEHSMAPYFMNKTLDHSELPKRFIGYSTAFRREAGTYGKDMGGILRVHHFDKLEIESFTDAESGSDEQKFIVALQEYMVQQLGIPYRLQQVCTGDTGKPDYQQFDIECWIPSQNTYRETHTSDYMTDYQTRGINSKYVDKEGNKEFLHTNDATAFAITRILIAIMENYQQADGSILVPEVLRAYMGGKELITR